VVIIHLGCQLPDTSAQPTRTIGLETGWGIAAPHCPYSVLLPMGFTLPRPLLARAVSSYLTLSPFPAQLAGGLLSVALSLGFAGQCPLPQPDVIRHRVSMEPGLSSVRIFSETANSNHPTDWQKWYRRDGEIGQGGMETVSYPHTCHPGCGVCLIISIPAFAVPVIIASSPDQMLCLLANKSKGFASRNLNVPPQLGETR